jgi:hypothetical protein
VLPWSRSKRGASRVRRIVSRDRRLTDTFANAAINRGGSYTHGNGQMVQRGQALRLHHAGRGGPRPVRPPVRVAADGPLKEGARVSFGAEQGDKGPKAVNVREL